MDQKRQKSHLTTLKVELGTRNRKKKLEAQENNTIPTET